MTPWSSSTPPSGAGGLPVDIAETDALLLAPQKNFASDGAPAAGEPGRPEPDRGHRRDRSLFLISCPCRSRREQLQPPDIQHTGHRHAGAAGRTDRLAGG